MYSLSIDYLFNRVYDVLLWIKYTWLFTILRNDKGEYIDAVSYRDWDGLRDRGWFDEYLALQEGTLPDTQTHISLWQHLLEKMGIRVVDSDGDGIPNISDSRPFDSDNTTKAELKERFEQDYSFFDHLRDLFGIGPKDSDKDGVPDSYEKAHGTDPENPDTDHDGLVDGRELLHGTDPLNPDTDGDMVLDGRDEAPLDVNVSSVGLDSDGDGVSDAVEKVIGTDPFNKDSDSDGIMDNMDTYPLDPENISKLPSFDIDKATAGFHLSIQNPILSFFSDILSILSIFALVLLVYVVSRWFSVFVEGLDHFEHHFGHDDHHGSSHKEGHHVIEDTSHANNNDHVVLGIPGLPLGEHQGHAPVPIVEQENHPKFSIIEGYMSSTSEALWRIGIMEADNLLGEALREKGYQGEGVGEMLKNASFRTVDLAWDAHKIRNRIAHEGSNFELTEREAKRAFSLFESVFRDLKVIT